MYYLRTRPKADAIQFTVDQASLRQGVEKEEKLTKELKAMNLSDKENITSVANTSTLRYIFVCVCLYISLY